MTRRHPANAEDLVTQFPHLAWHDGAVAAKLAAQSAQLVQHLAPILFRLLELVPGSERPGSRSAGFTRAGPVLTLKFLPLNPRRVRAPSEVPGILRAFAQLATHSQRLVAFPALKMQFWLDVLQSSMAHTYTYVQKNEFSHPSFPTFAIDFGHHEHQMPIDAALEDALVEFMTTPQSLEAPPVQKLSFGFVFRSCNLRVASLEVIERFLARSFASASRQYDVLTLEVSKEGLTDPDLGVLARIVQKCAYEYGVEELRLDSIVPPGSGGPRRDWSSPDVTPAPFLEIACAVFGVRDMPALASRRPALTNGSLPSRLRRVSMNSNDVCVELFATRFSALRYGCPIEEDVTTYSTKHECADYEGPSWFDCWRWLAFGLFYPRPKRFASRLRLRNIGHIEHCPPMAETVALTLRNPAAELIFDGKNEQGGSDVVPTTELLVCVVQAGARVDIFKTGNSVMPEWADSFATQCELEAIYERADGSVCVVVPGVGLGWVSAEFVVRIEREPLSLERREQDGVFAGDLACSTVWRRGYHWDELDLYESMHSLVETIGRQFHSLTFEDDHFASDFAAKVLDHCRRPRRLRLGTMKVPAAGVKKLLKTLDRAREHLEVLDLNEVTATTAFYEELFRMVSDAEHFPVLRELRIGGKYVSTKILTALHSMLRKNMELALVEVHIDQGMYWPKKDIADIRNRLNADFHGQLLRPKSKSKIAFLSVVHNGRSGGSKHAQQLDSWMIRTIFEFATDHDMRRTLIWNEKIEPGSYY